MIQIRFPLISKKVCQESHRVSLRSPENTKHERFERTKPKRAAEAREGKNRGSTASAEKRVAWGRGGGGGEEEETRAPMSI